MSETWFRVATFGGESVDAVDVLKATSCFLTIDGSSKKVRHRGALYCYFQNIDAAFDHLISGAEAQVEFHEENLLCANQKLGRILALKERQK